MLSMSQITDRDGVSEEYSVRAPQLDESLARPSGKSVGAFRTISEVSADLDVPQHVLRFWETKFSQLRPLKRGGGRRYYRPEDVALLRRIHTLLYREGYTIKGVQRVLRTPRKVDRDGCSDDLLPVAPPANPEIVEPEPTGEGALLHEILGELKALRSMLD